MNHYFLTYKQYKMRNIFLLSICVLAVLPIFGQDIYIKYDPAYFDKMEYHITDKNNTVNYFTYRLNKSATEKIFFETGIEGSSMVSKVPGKLFNPNEVNFDQGDVRAINNGTKHVYLVKKSGDKYQLMPTGSAEYMYFGDNLLVFDGSDYALAADYNQPFPENLATEFSNSAIFYAGDDKLCNKNSYYFNRSPLTTCKEPSNLTILPQVGLIKDQTGENNFELTSVNGMPLCEYIASLDAPPPPAPVVEEPIAAVETPAPPMPIAETFSAVTVAPVAEAPCDLTVQEGEHLVSQGQSLYGIARRNGVTVEQIMKWNNMENEKVYPCTKLVVVAPRIMVEPSEDIASRAVPTAFSSVTKQPESESCAITAKAGEYIVQRGDNLYAIARKQGLNVSQLRQWNKLKNDTIRACTRLWVVAPKEAIAVKAPKPKAKPAPPSHASTTVKKPHYVNKAPTKVVKKQEVKVQPRSSSSESLTMKSPKSTTVEKGLIVKKGSGMYVIKKGETLAAVAKANNTTEANLRKLNNLTGDEKVATGQVIITKDCACDVASTYIPKKYSYTYKAPQNNLTSKTVKEAPARTSKYHVVQENETINSISEQYNIPIKKLRALNSLSDNETVITNQLLVIE
jgi:LysM repeat protein